MAVIRIHDQRKLDEIGRKQILREELKEIKKAPTVAKLTTLVEKLLEEDD